MLMTKVFLEFCSPSLQQQITVNPLPLGNSRQQTSGWGRRVPPAVLQQLISRLFCGYDRFQLLDTKVHDLVRALRPRVFTSFTYPTVKRDPRPLASVSVLDLP
eukprot:910561-Amphidinium_carterae.1